MTFNILEMNYYFGETIKEENEGSQQDSARALIFVRHNLHEDLKNEYLIVKDSFTLCNNLKDRFNHKKKKVILPKARYDWMYTPEVERF